MRRARSSESFGTKERAYRLEVAKELRRVLEVASEGGPWLDQLRAVSLGWAGERPYDLTERPHLRWLQQLTEPEAFGRALSCFLDPALGPVERFDSFLQAAAKERPALLAPPESLANPDIGRDDGVLAMGSLFNFAAAPEDLPVIRPKVFNVLEQTLGYEWTYRISLVEQYTRHLAFAEDVKERLEAAGVPVRDMLDAQSLIQDAGVHADFWTAGPRSVSGKPYLSICAIYRDEGPYLR